jgi:2-dehydropantoate 2-reductase
MTSRPAHRQNTLMKICIYGAGAIGVLCGARLAADPNNQVSAVARGATLAALREHGWRLDTEGKRLQAPLHKASSDPRELGVQDLVIVTVKAQAMGDVADNIAPLLGPETIVLPAMNGVPWWFTDGLPDIGDRPLESVDPGGRIARSIALRHVVGCVVYVGASTPEPGVALHGKGNLLIIGEPNGGTSARTARLQTLLSSAGFTIEQSENVRLAGWYKLWGNMTVNPITAFTGANGAQLFTDPLVVEFMSACMREASAIGARVGCAIDESPADRHVVTQRLGAFRSSMLQDVEAGRSIELDAIVTAVHELGKRVGVATPNVDALLGLTRIFGRVRGLYPDPPVV